MLMFVQIHVYFYALKTCWNKFAKFPMQRNCKFDLNKLLAKNIVQTYNTKVRPQHYNFKQWMLHTNTLGMTQYYQMSKQL